jgi:hypothetical protein
VTDELISRLSADLTPVPPRMVERRLTLALAVGMALTVVVAIVLLQLVIGRPMGAAWGSPMFWVKGGYTLAFGLVGLAAAPALARPDGRIVWPLIVAGALLLVALCTGTMMWSRADWSMPMLMGATALVCPWLIVVIALPMLGSLLLALRSMAPRSPTMAGMAAGLAAGGFGALIYALYCGETGMMFMAVWYSLGVGLTAALGSLLGRWLLRW